MPRSLTYSALTLRVTASGESNREAWFFTAEDGVIKATVFGGPKSRLRARVAPFHEGKLWIYHDPVRDSRKVTDFDVQSYRTGIRELYERAMTAAAVAETVLASHGGGGSWPFAMQLAGGVLDALEAADAEGCSRLGVYFLWRWAALMGTKPELSACASCACEAGRDAVLWYSVRREALFCDKCMRLESQYTRSPTDSSSLLKLESGGRLWLEETEALAPAALAALETPPLEQAKALSKAVLAAALGKRLHTWEGI